MNREVVPVRRCSSWPGTARCSGRCEQVHCHAEAATICPAATLLSSCTLGEAKVFVDLLTDCLALWQELNVDDASDIEEHDF